MAFKAFDRRTFLRGGAFAVGLPLLEAMGPIARAAPPVSPDRFGLWFWGNGVRLDQWLPTGTGPGWSPGAALAPLADLLPYVSPITGCEIKTGTYPHHSGITGVLTGQPYLQLGTTRDTIISTFAGPSVDQTAAAFFEGQAPFHSLEIGISQVPYSDEGSTFNHVSHNGPNSPNTATLDPVALYARLFGGVFDPRRDRVRQSALDAVLDQANALRARLGGSDQARLDQHLESIAILEDRLATGIASCPTGLPPTAPVWAYGLEPITEQNEVMSDLLALALSCDLVRAFTVQFSTAGSGVVVWPAGAVEGLHSLTHFEGLPQPTVAAAVVFEMGCLATLLRKLRDTPEGDGNLLDHVSILATSEHTDGYLHSYPDFPLLLAGGGNGRLKPGTHYRSESSRSTSDAVLTALLGGGVDVPSFGIDAGYSANPITELLA